MLLDDGPGFAGSDSRARIVGGLDCAVYKSHLMFLQQVCQHITGSHWIGFPAELFGRRVRIGLDNAGNKFAHQIPLMLLDAVPPGQVPTAEAILEGNPMTRSVVPERFQTPSAIARHHALE